MSNNHQPQPALRPIAIPRVPTITGTPDHIREQFADARAAQEIIEIRKECAYRFLEEVFLPKVAAGYAFTCADTTAQIKALKRTCANVDTYVFDDFDLIASAQSKLELLRLDTTLDADLQQLLARACAVLQMLIDQCLDDWLDPESD
jgi:hypothetical protein